MTLEEDLSNINYNTKKNLEQLRKKIIDINETSENIGNRKIMYQCSGEDFCLIKIKKDHLEIDFKDNKILEDPMKFSWKIRPTKDIKFDRRMQIKNISQIDTAFGLIYQSFNKH